MTSHVVFGSGSGSPAPHGVESVKAHSTFRSFSLGDDVSGLLPGVDVGAEAQILVCEANNGLLADTQVGDLFLVLRDDIIVVGDFTRGEKASRDLLHQQIASKHFTAAGHSGEARMRLRLLEVFSVPIHMSL